MGMLLQQIANCSEYPDDGFVMLVECKEAYIHDQIMPLRKNNGSTHDWIYEAYGH
jgi:hypothetical protein